LNTWFINRLRQTKIDNFCRGYAVILQTHQDVTRLDIAVKGGATVLLGGKRVDRQGYFLEPTILSNVTPENPMFHQEFFASVAMIFPVKNDDETVKLADDSPYDWNSCLKTGYQPATPEKN
jgi:acyl-CoA reductase-like NAD-dependent aldehyde dehydrogenase